MLVHYVILLSSCYLLLKAAQDVEYIKRGLSDSQVEKILQDMKAVFKHQDITKDTPRKNIEENFGSIISYQTGTDADTWSVIVCNQNSCTWDLPACSKRYLTIKYHGYFLTASQCECDKNVESEDGETKINQNP